jgi:hypothetical protein
MAYYGTPAAVLELPPELSGVPPAVLKVKIHAFLRVACVKTSPDHSEQ